jgi:hypothetical protein
MQITRELLRQWNACWTDDAIADVVPVDGLTPAELVNLPSVSAEDKLWVVLREEIIPAQVLREFACDVAEEALNALEERGNRVDPRSKNAIAVSRKYARGGATQEQLSAARNAARNAACDAACDAVCSAAYRAACDAARNAAYSAAYRAAYRAACDAAYSAAYRAACDAVCNRQLSRISKIMGW